MSRRIVALSLLLLAAACAQQDDDGGGAAGGIVVTIATSPNPVNFAGQAVNMPSGPTNVTVTAAGTGNLTITGFTVTGDSTQFSVTNMPAVVSPGSPQDFMVTFTPTSVGAKTATITIPCGMTNATNCPHTIMLSGTGLLPMIVVTPTTVAFGNQQIGQQSVTRTFEIRNNGDVPLNVTSATLGGMHPTQFQIFGGPPFQVGPQGGTRTVFVVTNPSQAGPITATATVASDDLVMPAVVVTLTATGLVNVIEIVPPLIDYGPHRPPKTVGPRVVTVRNLCADPITLQPNGPGTITGPQTTSFPFTMWAGFTNVAPNATQTIMVSYDAAVFTPGQSNAVITVRATVGGGNGAPPVAEFGGPTLQATLTLTGFSGPGPFISVLPNPIDFGIIGVGDRATPVTVTITNLTPNAIDIGSVVTSAPLFPLDTLTTAGVLPGMGTKTFTVGFNPAESGVFNGTAQVRFTGETFVEGSVAFTGAADSNIIGGEGCPLLSVGRAKAGGGAAALLALAVLGLWLTRRRAGRRSAARRPR